jgi:hypothetical protein
MNNPRFAPQIPAPAREISVDFAHNVVVVGQSAIEYGAPTDFAASA